MTHVVPVSKLQEKIHSQTSSDLLQSSGVSFTGPRTNFVHSSVLRLRVADAPIGPRVMSGAVWFEWVSLSSTNCAGERELRPAVLLCSDASYSFLADGRRSVIGSEYI